MRHIDSSCISSVEVQMVRCNSSRNICSTVHFRISLLEFDFTEFEVMLRALMVRGSLRSAAVAACKMPTVIPRETPIICTRYRQQNKLSLDQVRLSPKY